MPSDAILAQLALFKNIPEELKALRQWVCWRNEDIGSTKPTKIPYTPTKQKASVTNPATWCDFQSAINAYSTGEFSGIGFVFTDNDDFCFIDLDQTDDPVVIDRQHKIYQEINSYSEISPSGNGLHIICKASIPMGRRRHNIEIYSSERYATFTGKVYNNVGIQPRQNEVFSLFEQLGESKPQQFIFQGEVEEKLKDEEVIKIAADAVNGEKFDELYKGRWERYYPSQSEADFALVNIIAFYTKNRPQISRIFRASGLGKRDKAKRQGYLNYMIDRSFDRELPPIDMDGLKIEVDKVINDGGVAKGLRPVAHNGSIEGSNPSTPTIYNFNHNAGSFNGRTAPFEGVNEGSSPSPASNIFKNPPPGLIGEIAQFIYQAAPRPVPEIALATAIGLMAGICGRAYNVSSTGLNQYVLLLAKTGRGKEAIQSGISKLIAAVAQQVPTIAEKIGPDEIASGQALYKYLAKAPGFVSVLSEFGLRLQQLSDMNGNGPHISLRRMMLQLYAKSGYNDVARPSIYSDKDKNIPAIHSPAFSILGESTPAKFYQNLNEDMISEGLLPRFLLIEYDGDRVPENSNHADVKPSFELIDKLAAIAANAQTVESASPRRVITVNFSEDAFKLSKQYSKLCDGYINNKNNNEVILELWNRAHLKAIKMAAIVAVGVNMWNPTIERSHLEWAIALVDEDIKKLTKRFESGRIGANTGEVKQIDEVLKLIKEYVIAKWDDVSKYCMPRDEKLHRDSVVIGSYISRRLMGVAAFRNDKIGATNAIKRTIQNLIDRDYIQEIPREQLKQKYGTTQKSYMITNASILKENDGE